MKFIVCVATSMLLVGTTSATWLRFCKSCAVDDLRSALRDGPEALISSSLKAYAFGVLPVAALKASGAELIQEQTATKRRAKLLPALKCAFCEVVTSAQTAR